MAAGHFRAIRQKQGGMVRCCKVQSPDQGLLQLCWRNQPGIGHFHHLGVRVEVRVPGHGDLGLTARILGRKRPFRQCKAGGGGREGCMLAAVFDKTGVPIRLDPNMGGIPREIAVLEKSNGATSWFCP